MLKDGLRAVLLTAPIMLALFGCSSTRQFAQSWRSPHRSVANQPSGEMLAAKPMDLPPVPAAKEDESTKASFIEIEPGRPAALPDVPPAAEALAATEGEPAPPADLRESVPSEFEPAQPSTPSEMPPTEQPDIADAAPPAGDAPISALPASEEVSRPVTENAVPARKGETVPDRRQNEILKYLESDEAASRESSAKAISPILNESPAESTPSESASVISDCPLFAEFSLKIVETFQDSQEGNLPILLRVLTDPTAESRHRARAAYLIGTLGDKAASTLPSFEVALADTHDKYLQIDLAAAIHQIAPENTKPVSLVLELLRDSDPQVQWWAAFSMRRFAGPDTTNAITELIAASRTNDLKLKRMVFLTLAAYGPAASAAVPELESALNSDDADTRVVAAACLVSVRPE